MGVVGDFPLKTESLRIMDVAVEDAFAVSVLIGVSLILGLVTVKDVLRFTTSEHQEPQSPWSEQRFDGIVDEARMWTSSMADDVVSWGRRVLRRS